MKDRLRAVRAAKGMNQHDFAKSLGIGQSTLAMMEVGKREISERHIKTICAVFGVNEEWMCTGKGDMLQQDSQSILDRLAEKYQMTVRDRAVISAFLQLNAAERAIIIRYAESIVAQLSRPAAVDDAAVAAIAAMQDYASMVADEKDGEAGSSTSAG